MKTKKTDWDLVLYWFMSSQILFMCIFSMLTITSFTGCKKNDIKPTGPKDVTYTIKYTNRCSLKGDTIYPIYSVSLVRYFSPIQLITSDSLNHGSLDKINLAKKPYGDNFTVTKTYVVKDTALVRIAITYGCQEKNLERTKYVPCGIEKGMSYVKVYKDGVQMFSFETIGVKTEYKLLQGN